jgi:hypothetical protein
MRSQNMRPASFREMLAELIAERNTCPAEVAAAAGQVLETRHVVDLLRGYHVEGLDERHVIRIAEHFDVSEADLENLLIAFNAQRVGMGTGGHGYDQVPAGDTEP